MKQVPTNTRRQRNAKFPDQWETWHSYDGGRCWTMVDSGYLDDPRMNDDFPLQHKFGWTENDGEHTLHFQVTNPEKFVPGCRAEIIRGHLTIDGSYHVEVAICD